MSRAMRRALTCAAIAGTTLGAFASAASADITGPQWNCRASGLFASVAGNNRVEPVVANGNQNTANGSPRTSPVRERSGRREQPRNAAAVCRRTRSAPNSISAITAVDPPLGASADQRGRRRRRRSSSSRCRSTTASTILGVDRRQLRAPTRRASADVPQARQAPARLSSVTLGGQDIIARRRRLARSRDALAPLGADRRDQGQRADQGRDLADRPCAARQAALGRRCDPAGRRRSSPRPRIVATAPASATATTPAASDRSGKQIKPCPKGSVLDLDSERCMIRGLRQRTA